MKKIIICSISIGLVLILGVSALVLALIPVGQNNLIDAPNKIYFFNKNTKDNYEENSYIVKDFGNDKEKEIIAKTYKLLNQGFGQKALTALFKGEINDKIETVYDKPTGASNSMSKNTDKTDRVTILFYYNEEKTIKCGDKEYKYQYLFFELDSSTGSISKTFGVRDTLTLSSDSYVSSTFSYDYSYVSKVNTTALFEYISSITFNKKGVSTSLISK